MGKITGKSQRGQEIPNLTEDQAREHIEKLLWPDGQPVCRHCGSVNAYRMQGKSCRPGLCRCRDCEKQFTVTVGTLMEDSHLPLALWVKAFHYMGSAKKGMSTLQLQRNLGIGSYKSAWFMAHRIRLAMRCEPMAGELSGTIEVDETYVGGKPRKFAAGDPRAEEKRPRGRGTKKAAVVVLVQRDGGARSHHVEKVDSKTLRSVITGSVHPSSCIQTDELPPYKSAAAGFEGGHHTVNHGRGEYVRHGNHINTAESFFALLKRGHYGIFHHISKKHLHRYCDEFDFRWGVRPLADAERRAIVIRQSEGKRLFYSQPVGMA